jgi:hypothetical protein
MKLSDKECKRRWEDPMIKIDISTSEGKQVMDWLQRDVTKSVSQKPCFDMKSGIN